MGLDRTRSTWADEPHPAPIPLSPTPRAPTVRPVPGPLSAAPQGRRHDFGPCSFRSLWSQRERVHPIPAPPHGTPDAGRAAVDAQPPSPPQFNSAPLLWGLHVPGPRRSWATVGRRPDSLTWHQRAGESVTGSGKLPKELALELSP